MGALITYYSFSGKTKMLAEAVSKVLDAESLEIIEKKRHSTLGAYFIGARNAMQGKTTSIIGFDLASMAFDSVVLFSPVWAGSPVPAVNAAIDAMDLDGIPVMVCLVQKGMRSESAEEKIRERLLKRGAKVIGCSHIQMDAMDPSWVKTKSEVIAREFQSRLNER